MSGKKQNTKYQIINFNVLMKQNELLKNQLFPENSIIKYDILFWENYRKKIVWLKIKILFLFF
ncbi:MAG: hypothetical protein V1649_01665, partial [Patescibacteria group bacterium]